MRWTARAPLKGALALFSNQRAPAYRDIANKRNPTPASDRASQARTLGGPVKGSAEAADVVVTCATTGAETCTPADHFLGRDTG